MPKKRSSNYTDDEDEHLIKCWIEISEDPEIGNRQSKSKFWERVTKEYNNKPSPIMPDRNQRSIQCHMQKIKNTSAKFKGCVDQIERQHPSGASENDIYNMAKTLYLQECEEPFLFDHVWHITKNLKSYSDDNPRKPVYYSPDEQESLIPSNPELSLFSINLSDENASGGSSSLRRPDGVKKTKMKRKQNEDMSEYLKSIQQDNARLQELMIASVSRRDHDIELRRERIESQKQMAESQRQLAEATKLAEENKILMMDLEIITDPRRREYFRKTQEKILQEKVLHEKNEQVQPQAGAFNMFGGFFQDLGGSGSNLGDY